MAEVLHLARMGLVTPRLMMNWSAKVVSEKKLHQTQMEVNLVIFPFQLKLKHLLGTPSRASGTVPSLLLILWVPPRYEDGTPSWSGHKGYHGKSQQWISKAAATAECSTLLVQKNISHQDLKTCRLRYLLENTHVCVCVYMCFLYFYVHIYIYI